MNIIYGLLLVLIMAMPLKVNACSCGDMTPEESIINTDLIFKGKVLSVEPIPSPDGMDWGKKAKFKVLVSYKGTAFETVEIGYVTSGASCGWGFTEGTEVTVFADGNTKQGFRTGMCTMLPYAYAMKHHDMSYQSAIETYRTKRAAFLKAPVTVKRLREQATFFVKYHDYEDAETAFNKLLAKQPKDIAALMGRADVYYQLKRYELALADYRSALNLNTNHQAARHGKTLSLLKLGRINELEPQDKDFSGYEQDNDKLSFAGLNLTGANFSHASFNEIDFSGADLTNADFSEADLLRCNFTGAKLSHAKFYKVKNIYDITFNKADLQFADFSESYLRFTHFDNAVLDYADFSNANIESAFFEKVLSMQGTKFIGTRFGRVKFQGIKFDGYDFSNAIFGGADLRDSSFSNSQINGARFGSSSDLRGADLSNADLTGVKWEMMTLIDCRTKFPKNYDISTLPILPLESQCKDLPSPLKTALTGFHLEKIPALRDIEAQNYNFSGMKFSGFEFNGGNFDGSNFSNTSIKNATLINGSYQNTNFENADLTHAELHNVNFSGASFDHAVLSEATLDNVDFSNANFEGVVMTDVVFDEKTKFPEGFDPLAAGAKKRVEN